MFVTKQRNLFQVFWHSIHFLIQIFEGQNKVHVEKIIILAGESAPFVTFTYLSHPSISIYMPISARAIILFVFIRNLGNLQSDIWRHITLSANVLGFSQCFFFKSNCFSLSPVVLEYLLLFIGWNLFLLFIYFLFYLIINQLLKPFSMTPPPIHNKQSIIQTVRLHRIESNNWVGYKVQ